METNDKLLKPGFAYFDIVQVNDTKPDGTPLLSKSGAIMLKLTLNVTDSEGKTVTVYDYLIEGIEWKIFSLQKCLNINGHLLNLNKPRSWNKELLYLYRSGLCSIKTEISKDPRWEDKTVIAAYLPNNFIDLSGGSKKESGPTAYISHDENTNTFTKHTFTQASKQESLEPVIDDDDIPF